MKHEFIQPVSMRVTKEQYERDLREPLLKIGYEEVCFTDLDKLNILITSENGLVSNSNEKSCFICGRHFIPEYNPQLFIAIAAMTKGETPIVREWLVCIKGSSLFGYKIGQVVQNQNPKLQLDNYYRKATLQELIEKFTNKETIKESVMKIEVIKPQKEVEWTFPCKGISKISKDGDVIVGFSGRGKGTVLETKNEEYPLYEFREDWVMPLFELVVENQLIDWNDPKNFPIVAEEKDDIIIIHELELSEAEDREDDGRCCVFISYLNSKTLITRSVWKTFNILEDRMEWLNSLKILPKGSEIKITL